MVDRQTGCDGVGKDEWRKLSWGGGWHRLLISPTSAAPNYCTNTSQCRPSQELWSKRPVLGATSSGTVDMRVLAVVVGNNTTTTK